MPPRDRIRPDSRYSDLGARERRGEGCAAAATRWESRRRRGTKRKWSCVGLEEVSGLVARFYCSRPTRRPHHQSLTSRHTYPKRLTSGPNTSEAEETWLGAWKEGEGRPAPIHPLAWQPYHAHDWSVIVSFTQGRSDAPTTSTPPSWAREGCGPPVS